MKELREPTGLYLQGDVIRLGTDSFVLLSDHSEDCLEFGLAERFVLDSLQQRCSRSYTQAEFKKRFGRRLSDQELGAFERQLLRYGVLKASRWCPPELPAELGRPARPFSRDDRGANLNSFFDAMVVLLGWMFHPVFAWLGVACFLLGVLGVAQNAAQYVSHVATLFGDAFWSTFALVLVARAFLISFAREFVRGVAARRFGGRVKAFQLRFWRGLIPYCLCRSVDVCVGRHESKRWIYLSTDIWVHFWMTGLAVCAWFLAPMPSFLADLMALLVLLGGIGLVLRCNPFAESNGYALLCDHFRVENLAQRAQSETVSWLLLLPAPEPLSVRERYWFRCYGLAALVVGILAAVFLGFLLWTRFAEAGLVAACVLLVVWRLDVWKNHGGRYPRGR